MLKQYQPERTDFMINTAWGIPKDQLATADAQSRGLRIFHGRWVTADERKRLRTEYSAYHSLRMAGGVLFCAGMFMLLGGLSAIAPAGGVSSRDVLDAIIALPLGMLLVTTTVGFWRFRAWAAALLRVATYVSALLALSILLWVRAGMLNWNAFERSEPIIADLFVFAAITAVVGGIGTYYSTRPIAHQILR
jgi:hypothetical protein